MAKKLERFERLYQCARCKHRFTVNITPEEAPDVRCPRSCPAKVTDVTDEVVAELERHRAEVAARMEKRRIEVEAATKAQEEAMKKSLPQKTPIPRKK